MGNKLDIQLVKSLMYKDIVINLDRVNTWIEFLQDPKFPAGKLDLVDKRYLQMIEQLCDNDEWSLYVDFWDIHKFSDELCMNMIYQPELYIIHLEKAIYELCPADAKKHIRARIINFPTYTNLYRCNTQIGKLVSLDVFVRKVKQKYKLLTKGVFKCRRCEHLMSVEQKYHEGLQEPIVCENENCGRTTGQTSFQFLQESSEFIEAEDITLEDPLGDSTGHEPYQMLCLATDDLTQKIKPGQHIRVNGIFKVISRYSRHNKKSLKFQSYLLAHSFENLTTSFEHIKINKNEEKAIIAFSKSPGLRYNIKRMIAPFIFGCDEIKHALALFLFGGVEKYHKFGHHKRGDFHILLIGDPGLAKSQLLKFVAKVAPKGIYGSGKSSTDAGLTSTAKQDEDGWYIEAGLLPQADQGVACIDEIDKMRDTDRNSIHEVMEQQTVSGAKAGIVYELLARCGILAAANPKEGRFDPMVPLLDQTDLGSVLMSRFALIFPLEDKIDEYLDSQIAEHILTTSSALRDSMEEYADSSEEVNSAESILNLPMELDMFIKYIAYAKQLYHPKIPEKIQDKIRKFYVTKRLEGKPTDYDQINSTPLTPRQVEDIIRLVEASARMRLSDVANEDDFEHAIMIFSSYMDKVARTRDGKWDIDRISADKSSEDRFYMKELMTLVNQYDNQYKKGIPVDLLKTKMVDESNMDEFEFFKAINILVDKGQFLSMQNGKKIKLIHYNR